MFLKLSSNIVGKLSPDRPFIASWEPSFRRKILQDLFIESEARKIIIIYFLCKVYKRLKSPLSQYKQKTPETRLLVEENENKPNNIQRSFIFQICKTCFLLLQIYKIGKTSNSDTLDDTLDNIGCFQVVTEELKNSTSLEKYLWWSPFMLKFKFHNP